MNKIFVVPHGVDHEIFKEPPAQKVKRKPSTLLYIGRLEHKKNIKNLIEAFNILNSIFQIRNAQLVLVGSPGYGYGAIKKEIEKSPYQNNIIQTGWANQAKTVEYLQNATMLVFPSLYEGFGLPILEAAACGAPICCSDIAPFQEVAGDIPVYFNPADSKSIAESIWRLLQDEHSRKQKIARGLNRAQQYTWSRSAQKTLEILITEAP
jgi:glycosyltransferase involved in cell wall biosynthesis